MKMKKFTGKAGELQRKAVVTAAGAAALGAAPALSMAHGHHWLGFSFIGLQLVLIVMAMNFVVQMKRVKARDNE